MELLQQQKKKPKKYSLQVPDYDPYARLTLKNKIRCVAKETFDEQVKKGVESVNKRSTS